MRGYRKISEHGVKCSSVLVLAQDNYGLDEDIRGAVHSPIIGENEKSGCEEFKVVVYKKVNP